MASAPARVILRQLHHLEEARAATRTDERLLHDFVARQDGAAFAALVERHGPMVLAVGRRALGDRHAAEDVFQATFLVLARKAASVRRARALGSWLYGVAYRLALRARADAARRAAREQRAASRAAYEPADDVAARELAGLLDEELHRLSEKHRLPLVLCYLEGRTRDQAARQMGWSLRTFHRRLDQARTVLRARLARRGLAAGTPAMALLLTREAAPAAVPPGLAAAGTRAACELVAGQAVTAGVVSARAAALVRREVPSAGVVSVKLTAALVLATALMAGGAGALVHRGAVVPAGADESKPAAPQAPALPRPAAKAAMPDQVRAEARRLLREALEALDGAQSNTRTRTMFDIAILQVQLGDRVEAQKAFAKARDYADALPENSRYWEYRELAKAHARAGDAVGALGVAQSIPDAVPNFRGHDKGFRDMVLQECATALAQARQGGEALRMVDRITDKESVKWIRPMVETDLALALAKAGDVPAALRAVDRMRNGAAKVMALTGVLYLNPTYTPLPNHPGVALLQAEAGDRDGARRTLAKARALARTLPDDKERPRALAALACAEARLGELPAAQATAKSIAAAEYREMCLGAIARALAAAGRRAEAERVAGQVQEPAAKVMALHQLGVGLAQGGAKEASAAAFRRAVELADTLANDERASRSGAFHNIASSQAVAGDFAGAAQTARDYLTQGSIAWANIAHELARSGDVTEALRAAGAFREGDWWRGNVIRDVARVQADKGQAKKALEWVGELATPYDKANALLGVAEGLTAKWTGRRE